MAAQQLNPADRLAVRPLIVPRCTAHVANYALYLLGLQESTQQQKAWAREAISQPEEIGAKASWHVLNQNEFLDNGTDIDDEVLKGIVETAINNYFIVPA